MERKGGCCIAPRYGAAAGGQQAGAAWQMGRIMLKFRPIAPKPAAMAPVPTPAPVPAAAAGAGRGKRKAVGGGGGRRGRKPKRAATVAQVVAPAVSAPVAPAGLPVGECRKDKDCEKEKSLSSRSSSSSGMTSVDSLPQQHHQPTTLPLMPVSPVEEKATAAAATVEPSAVAAPGAGAHPAPPRALRPVPAAAATWVTVEEVTATWRDGEEAPSSAARIGAGPDGDAAPAFVSDQWGRVTWSNAAFARAVSADDEAGASAPAVALAGALPAWGTCAGFTCRVRVVRHAAPRRAGGSSVVAPCDVWLLDAAGCYLWRLDLQAALTLGGLP
ncbi:uncharacterized protein [Setaria viridis]|uniref:DUF7950 domain-containing protein n=1 Tax=Setaria viridis TaxID=4556 RepID=A0A4U6VA51_SETVI|nr:skin secretory protein xP2-like [Setaria viridis]TKW25024.1 hypothetical protein SEVIR_3G089200v2 [Setaria viridis]